MKNNLSEEIKNKFSKEENFLIVNNKEKDAIKSGLERLLTLLLEQYDKNLSTTLTHQRVRNTIFENQKQENHFLINFHDLFFQLPYAPNRTKKHVATPKRNSACKRLNMFLRWMVRRDSNGVDFGLWDTIKPYQLVCPCDLHVDRVARKLGLITRKQTDWQTAKELTGRLREFDPQDPVKYDFALFGLGIEEKF